VFEFLKKKAVGVSTVKCKANSCPLDVDFITNWENDEFGKKRPKWGVCRYHRNAQPDEWVRTTDRIKANALGVLAIRTFRNIERDPVFKPIPGETTTAYFDRIENQVRLLINGNENEIDGDDAFRKIISLLSG